VFDNCRNNPADGWRANVRRSLRRRSPRPSWPPPPFRVRTRSWCSQPRLDASPPRRRGDWV